MTQGNFAKLSGILSKTTVHVQPSLLSLLPFLPFASGETQMNQKQTIILSLFLMKFGHPELEKNNCWHFEYILASMLKVYLDVF